MTTRREKFLTALVNDLQARAEKATGAERDRLERAAKYYLDALLRGWR